MVVQCTHGGAHARPGMRGLQAKHCIGMPSRSRHKMGANVLGQLCQLASKVRLRLEEIQVQPFRLLAEEIDVTFPARSPATVVGADVEDRGVSASRRAF